jgi:hypothetical protein
MDKQNRVEALKALHTIESLFSKSSWYYHFAQAFKIHKNLPETDKNYLQETVNRLKSYFESQNKPVPASIVLELACFTSGRKQRIATPTDLLKSNKGGFSEANLIEAAMWIEGIKSFRQDILDLPEKEIEAIANFINHDDTRENLHEHLFIHWTYKHGIIEFEDLPNLILDYLRQMSLDEVVQLANYALEVWDSNEEHPKHAEKLLMRLFCLHPDKFPPIHMQMLELGIDYPYHFYLKANRELSLAVAEKLPFAEGLKKSRLYEIFVRGGAAYVHQQLNLWEDNPPRWWENSFLIYPLEAGWELTEEGKRRQLYYETCYPLVLAAGEKPKMEREDTCQWCNQKLMNFLDLDLTDSRLAFLKLEGSRLIIVFCQWCHAFQDQYFELDFEGNARWSAFNSPEPPSRIEYYDEEPNTLILAEKPRGTFESLIMEHGQSQIGGFPAWINDADYPLCPSCLKHMQFIGQVQWWDVDKGHVEGNSYALLCPDCKISLVNYDQT